MLNWPLVSCGAEFKNEWRCASTFPCLNGMHMDDSSFKTYLYIFMVEWKYTSFGIAISNGPNFRFPYDRWIWSCDEIIMRGENLPHWHFTHHKSHTRVRWIENVSCAVRSQWQAAWAMPLSAAFTDLKINPTPTDQSNSCCMCKYS